MLPLITSTADCGPARALLQAAELDALSERFDAAMVHALGEWLDTSLDDADYAAATAPWTMRPAASTRSR